MTVDGPARISLVPLTMQIAFRSAGDGMVWIGPASSSAGRQAAYL